MMPPRHAIRIGLAWVLLGLAGVGAADWPEGWKQAQALSVNRTGLIKVRVPLESLTAARGQLEDLRLLDPKGREVSYLLVRPGPIQSRTVAAVRFASTVMEERTVLELATGVTQAIAAVRLLSPAPEFLKAVRLEGSQDQESWRVLADGRVVFRQRGGVEQLKVEVGGAWRFLRLTLDDRRSSPVPFTSAELQVEGGPAGPAEPLPIALASRVEETGESRLRLQAAGPNVTLAELILETPEPLFMRSVTLSHPRYANGELQPVTFAQGVVFRVDAQAGAPSAKLAVAVEAPLATPEILMTIRNDDNPPLQVSGIRATWRPVHLLFHAAEAGEYTILSGNADCNAPRYELAAMLSRLPEAPLVEATVGGLVTNPRYRPVDPLAAVPTDGAPLKIEGWSHRRPVLVEEDGWQQLELDWSVLARAARSGADLRLVREGRQVPYVLERLTEFRRIPLQPIPADDPARPQVSRWKMDLPEAGVPVQRLSCRSPAAYFERSVRLLEERRDERGSMYPVALGSASWIRRDQRLPAPLNLTLNAEPMTRTLFLEIENGDNPPLAFDQWEAAYTPLRVLFRAAPGPGLFLYYGNPEAAAPRYDLAAAMPRLLNMKRIQAGLGPVEQLRSQDREGGALSGRAAGWVFWCVLVAVVIGLLAIIARLLPKPESNPPGGGAS